MASDARLATDTPDAFLASNRIGMLQTSSFKTTIAATGPCHPSGLNFEC
jgi:hypothetical protein